MPHPPCAEVFRNSAVKRSKTSKQKISVVYWPIREKIATIKNEWTKKKFVSVQNFTGKRPTTTSQSARHRFLMNSTHVVVIKISKSSNRPCYNCAVRLIVSAFVIFSHTVNRRRPETRRKISQTVAVTYTKIKMTAKREKESFLIISPSLTFLSGRHNP